VHNKLHGDSILSSNTVVHKLLGRSVDVRPIALRRLIAAAELAANRWASRALTTNHGLITGIMPSMRVWKEEVFGPVLPVVFLRERRGS
jgi:hypothetical protein